MKLYVHNNISTDKDLVIYHCIRMPLFIGFPKHDILMYIFLSDTT